MWIFLVSVAQLSRAMKLGDLGNQSETKARRAYLDNHGADFDVGSELFVREIINEKVKNDDSRL